MNTIDYFLLAALAGADIYTFYRLFLGYVSSRFRDVEAADGNDHPLLPGRLITQPRISNSHLISATATGLAELPGERSNNRRESEPR